MDVAFRTEPKAQCKRGLIIRLSGLRPLGTRQTLSQALATKSESSVDLWSVIEYGIAKCSPRSSVCPSPGLLGVRAICSLFGSALNNTAEELRQYTGADM